MILVLGNFKAETHLVNIKAETDMANIKAETHLGNSKAETHLGLFLFGYSAFLFDYLAAANTIISSGQQDQVIGVLIKTGRQGMQASGGQINIM